MTNLVNETPERVLSRYSRKDILKGTAIAAVLGAMGMNWRPRRAVAQVGRITPGMTPTQINSTIAQANSSASPLVFAHGKYAMGHVALAPFDGLPVAMGEAIGTTISFGSPGRRAASVISGGQGGDAVRVMNLRFVGPAGAVNKGGVVNNQDGFSVGGESGAGRAHVRFRDCGFEGWNHAVVLENGTGHVFFSDCEFAMSTFNIWLRRSNGAYEFIRCDNSNPAKACYRLSRGELFENTVWQRGHHTNAPYIFYRTSDVQQRSGIGMFLQRCTLTNEQFEWNGNGLLYSEPGSSGISGTRFSRCGQSFNTAAQWAGRPRDYMIDTGYLNGVIIENCDQWDSGTRGLIRVAQSSSLQWIGKKPAGIVVGPFSKILDHSLLGF